MLGGGLSSRQINWLALVEEAERVHPCKEGSLGGADGLQMG